MRQRIGLEPWGRMLAGVPGLDAQHAFFQQWAHEPACKPDELAEGAVSLLDIAPARGSCSTATPDLHEVVGRR
jgi:hypothetical protein